MYHGYYRLTSLDQIIALYSKIPAAIAAARRIRNLQPNLCANTSISEEDWDFLASKVKSSDDVYSLAYNSKTLKQADAILRDKRHTPKVGLIRGGNPAIDGDYLRLIYENSQESATIQDSLLNRSDLPIDVLEKIAENPKTYYRIIYALTHNNNITDSWIIGYFNHTSGDVERKALIQRMPTLVDKYPGLKDHFLPRLLAEDTTIKSSHRLELLSVIAETRHLADSEARDILKYLTKTKSQSQTKVKIILGLLGNPNIALDTSADVAEFGRAPKIQRLATLLQRDKLESRADLRKNFPSTILPPGWVGDLTPNQERMMEVFGSEAENHPARMSVVQPEDIHATRRRKGEDLTAEQARSLLVRPSDESPYWTWRESVSNGMWYIDQEYSDEDEKTWYNLLSLCETWEGTLADLLCASRNI